MTTPEPAVLDGWELTGRISPRRLVRAAAVDAAGRPVNAYPLVHPISGLRPRVPWAVHLTDRAGHFRLLCADLDAKPSPTAAALDADRLSGLLTELAVPHLVCESGPTGGRHVWVALAEPIPADLVGVLARLLKGWLPTLDTAPLLNPATGCVRPPGAPHRLGGASRPLAGTLAALTTPSVTAGQVRALIGRLAAHHLQATATQPAWAVRRPIAVADGLPFLPGPRGALSPTCRALLEAAPAGDLSAVLWRILCGAAAAHWRYPDVAAIAAFPGLEHARTLRTGPTRTPRPPTGPASPTAVLHRQWTRAVHTVAALQRDPERGGDDPTFDARAERVTALVRVVQSRADATPGRWGASRAGLAHRRVLDALCLYHLQAVRADDVEADIRRLALACGLDRETARRALLALAADGWISRTRAAAGRHGAHWTIDPAGSIHTRLSRTLSQADPRPAHTGAALRTLLLRELDDRLQTGAHDAFTPRQGLGLEAGNLYGRLSEPLSTAQTAQLMGWTATKTGTILGRLAAAGLVAVEDRCWQRTSPEHLDDVALQQGTAGHHRQRAARYELERAAWAWWQAELTALRTRRHTRTRPSSGPKQRPSSACWPAHPRRRNGRADFARARHRLLAAQRLETQRHPQRRPRTETLGQNQARC